MRWLHAIRDAAFAVLTLATIAGIVTMAAAAPAPAADPGPSEAIFPPQEIPLRFSHAFHLDAVGMECEDCHPAATTSRSALDLLLPTEAACRECHDIDRSEPEKEARPAARCDACHTDYEPTSRFVKRVRIPFPNIKFSHKAHVDRGMACTGCHGDLATQKVDLATREQLPRMDDCVSCHDGKRAPGECTTCHLAEAGGFLQTDFLSGALEPSGQVIGARHDLGFKRGHGALAESNGKLCDSCHRKSFCVDCHAGVSKPMEFHLGDYIARHAQEARRNNPDCSSCHRRQTFCVGCHSRSGVVADGRGSEFTAPSAGLRGRGFHPPGWVEFSDSGLVTGDGSRGRSHHSFEAQRNIRQCASCHRESFCLGCHSTQPMSLGVSPHPRGWARSRRCRSLLARSGRMCMRCHVDVDEVRCD